MHSPLNVGKCSSTLFIAKRLCWMHFLLEVNVYGLEYTGFNNTLGTATSAQSSRLLYVTAG